MFSQLKCYVVKNYWRLSAEQKYEVYLGFAESGLTVRQVEVYAQPDLGTAEMNAIRIALSNGISCNDMRICCDYGHSAWRINLIAEVIRSKMSYAVLLKIADPNLSDEDADLVVRQLKKG